MLTDDLSSCPLSFNGALHRSKTNLAKYNSLNCLTEAELSALTELRILIRIHIPRVTLDALKTQIYQHQYNCTKHKQVASKSKEEIKEEETSLISCLCT